MSNVTIKSITGSDNDTIDLPAVFDTPLRTDLIKRAVLAEQSKNRQPQGRYKLAGKLTVATGVRPGRGISLIPRTHGKGTHHGNRGAVVPSTRGGRLAHPPRVEKNYVENINKKEYAFALRAAVAATKDHEVVTSRGHRINDDVELPIIVEDRFTEIGKTTELIEVLENLGLGEDLKRAKGKRIRAGKGKMRGRKYSRRKGPLIIVKDDCNVVNAGSNIPGVDVVKINDLNIEDIAPGTAAGRVTVWTEGALKVLEEWK